MGYKPKHLKKIRIPIYRYMIYLLIITTVVTGVTFSRYTTSTSGRNAARVAMFAHNYSITDPHSGGVIELNPSIYATSKLTYAEDCSFDEVAVVRTIEISNDSETSVHTVFSDMTQMTEDGVVWCILNGEVTSGYAEKISDKVSTKLGRSVPNGFTDLKNALGKVNSDAISAWNSANASGLSVGGKSTYLTVIFWAEYDQVTLNGFTSALTDNFELTMTVSQID